MGFRIADELAFRIGIHTDSDFRIRSGILYTLMQASQDGHTCLPRQLLSQKASELLKLEPQYIEKHYMDLAIDKKVVIKDTADVEYIYASSYYYMHPGYHLPGGMGFLLKYHIVLIRMSDIF